MRKNATEVLLHGLDILIADGNAYMRRLTRNMLHTLGARSVTEAGDGLAALEVIRTRNPDVMLLDWDIPALSSMEVVRMVRSPGTFPRPHVPIILLSSNANHSIVAAAMRAGVHELLIKPTSPKALRERLTAIISRPRRMTQVDGRYVPQPRPAAAPRAGHARHDGGKS